jgi:branched-chain amino acid transport system ATP-binding protein
MLAISRALLCSPELLLLDEPSLGLAPRLVETVFEALEGLRAAGSTILLVEQNAAQAVEFADRTYVLSGGRIVVEGTRDELRADARIESAYLGSGLASA